jgi:hypothetical protein
VEVGGVMIENEILFEIYMARVDLDVLSFYKS